jgi:protein-L-isoaspartate(D-aspartate) O-methyltransferase
MVIPLGDRYNQIVYLKTKRDGKLVDVRELRSTLFVPMTGRAQREASEERKKVKP